MENKYYQPKIEEFHIGFRFEFKSTLTTYIPNQEPIVRTDWLEAVTSTDFPNLTIPMIDAIIEEGNIRVKALDEADIIEAGWKYSKRTISVSNDRQYYSLGRYECHYSNKQYEDGLFRIYREYAEDGEYLFEGKIQNYNELLKVMEMLDIKAE